MTKNIIGLVGFIGHGKGTVGDYLVSRYGYRSDSFANSLKDALAAIFGWPRALLEGDTPESRQWREQPDAYWSARMGRTVTPRWATQYIGTDVMRANFFNDLWVASLEKKLQEVSGNITITDARFPNEIKMIRDNGGSIWWVKRNTMPSWYDCAVNNPEQMPILWKDVHPSEYMWLDQGPFINIDNSGSLSDLYAKIDGLMHDA